MAIKNMNIGNMTNTSTINVHLMGNINYAACSTAAATVAKVATVDSSFNIKASSALPTGFRVVVNFANANTATNPTLAISNGSATSSAYRIYKFGTTSAASWNAGSMIPLTFNGTAWILDKGIEESMSTLTINVGSQSVSYNGSSTQTVTISAADLGLSQAMKFLGTTTTSLADGSTTKTISIGGTNVTVATGDVALYGNYEYVWTGSAWELLGGDSSYKVVQTAVSDPTASGSAINFIATISQDANGNITATKSTVRDASASQSGVVSTGAQTFAGAKTFNSSVTSSYYICSSTVGYGTEFPSQPVNGQIFFKLVE